MKTNQSTPTTINKKPFILIRWGSVILLVIAILMFLAGFPSPSSTATSSEKASYGIIYLICLAGIFILSVIRIVKKHHRVLSIIWILFAFVLLYFFPIFWAPGNNINSVPGVVGPEDGNKSGN
ncbi:MAG: hypothetical protein AAB461_03655 [Patescibacteria group bacterium]